MKICPEITELERLVGGALTGEIAVSMMAHVDDCEKCQLTMGKITARKVATKTLVGETTVAQPVQLKRSDLLAETIGLPALPPEDPSLTETHAVGGLANNSEAPTDAGIDLAVSTGNELGFLTPSSDSAYIGCLEHFQVSRVIGKGGMGVVLEAFDSQLQRTVAIKVLNDQFQQNESAIERFCREGRAAASISHEHVVQMHQVSEIEKSKTAFLVMQMIDGKTLEAYTKENSPLESGEVARIGMQIAAGLSAAHSNGLVHRDIKPANILIENETKSVKITDFGLARSDSDLKLTQTGMLLGTALYMSPEQAIGKPVDERSDLFSLGAVMYEMATGESPFTAPTAVGVMKRIMDEDPPVPQSINAAIGSPMSDLIMQLIAKEPNDRPDSTSQVARALASIVTEHGPISPLQVPSVASSEVRKLSNKPTAVSRGLAIGGWAVAIALLVGLAVPLAMGWSPWGSSVRTVSASLDTDAVFVALNSSVPAEDVTSQFPSVLLGDNPGTVWSICFSADRKTIAAGIGDGSVRLWDIEKQELIRSFNAHEGNVWNVQFHPKLNLLATAGDDAWVKIWDATTFELKHGWKADNTVRAMAFSPTSDELVAGDRAGMLHVYDINTGQETGTHSQDGTILGVDYSGDGKLLATVGSDKAVRIFDAATFDQRQTFTGHEGPIYSVEFAPEGPILASVGWKGDIWVWDAITGENVLKLEGTGGDNWGVGFCGYDRYLVAGNQEGAVQLWSMETGNLLITFQGHSGPVHDIAFDPEGNRMATGSRDGTVRIWDTQSLKKVTE